MRGKKGETSGKREALIRELDKRFFSTRNMFRRKDGYCDLCKSTRCRRKAHAGLERGIRDVKEGRTYKYSCATNRKGVCGKSGQKPGICPDCLVEDCERWYRLGRKDERKKAVKKR